VKISFDNMEIGDLEIHAILKTEEGKGLHSGTLITKQDLIKHGFDIAVETALKDIVKVLKDKAGEEL